MQSHPPQKDLLAFLLTRDFCIKAILFYRILINYIRRCWQEFEDVLDQATGQTLFLIGSGYSKLTNEIGRDGGRTIFDAL